MNKNEKYWLAFAIFQIGLLCIYDDPVAVGVVVGVCAISLIFFVIS